MKEILLLNTISEKGLALFDPTRYRLLTECPLPDGVLVRSAKMQGVSFGENLLAVARAGAGVNNIPVEDCSQKGIVVFNTPGANANGVKELTLAALLLAARRIPEGIAWAESLAGGAGEPGVEKAVEKGKGAFAGIELAGKTLGVIGLGAIGGRVANAAASSAFGMQVIGYDPYLSVESAWSLSPSVKRAAGYEEIFQKSDFITLHVPASAETKGLIGEKALSVMKEGVRIVNLARAELVDSAAMVEAVKSGRVARYVTDFPTEALLGVENIVTIPHLGASTGESEENCALLAAEELIDYLENGNIKNSVNFPTVVTPRSGRARLCVIHANIPAVLSKISQIIADENINIEHMTNRSRGELAYTVADIGSPTVSPSSLEKIGAIGEVIRVRLIV